MILSLIWGTHNTALISRSHYSLQHQTDFHPCFFRKGSQGKWKERFRPFPHMHETQLCTLPQCFSHGPHFMWVSHWPTRSLHGFPHTHTTTAIERTCVMAALPERRPFCQCMWEERSTVTSHEQMHCCNALVTAVDISTIIGACIPVSGLGNTERAAGVVAECILSAFPSNFRLS